MQLVYVVTHELRDADAHTMLTCRPLCVYSDKDHAILYAEKCARHSAAANGLADILSSNSNEREYVVRVNKSLHSVWVVTAVRAY